MRREPPTSRERDGGEGSAGSRGPGFHSNRDECAAEVEGGGAQGAFVPGRESHEGTGKRVAEDEWIEETVEHPAPDYGLDSPVIRYLLQLCGRVNRKSQSSWACGSGVSSKEDSWASPSSLAYDVACAYNSVAGKKGI